MDTPLHEQKIITKYGQYDGCAEDRIITNQAILDAKLDWIIARDKEIGAALADLLEKLAKF